MRYAILLAGRARRREDVAAGTEPRRDWLELADALGAQLIEGGEAGRAGAIPGMSAAWRAFARRGYGTLIEAVRGLDLVVTVAAASAWSRNDPLPDQTLPANVVKRRLDYRGLRDLYDRSEFVVVPLQDVDFQAGSLVMYEAMAMGKAVIATRTRAHRDGDIVRDGETGLLVPPGDPGALREAIVRLHTDPAAAR